MSNAGKTQTAIKVLLACGILSSLLYIATDIVTATMLYPGYSYTSQQVSELSAVGAPTRPLWIAMTSIWSPLVIAFGIGVWLLAGQKRTLRVSGILLAMWGVVGFAWMFFPMQQPGTGTVANDAMHIAVGVVQITLMLSFIAFGAVAVRRGFSLYSIVTIGALLVFGALVSTRAAAIAAGQSTPWMGVIERVSVYTPILWVLVFATVLLRAQSTPTAESITKSV